VKVVDFGIAIGRTAAAISNGGPSADEQTRQANCTMAEASQRRLDDVPGAGMTFTAATAAKRLTRATAERALAAFMERVASVNSDPYFLGQVPRVALFGSMLNPDTDRPSDIDLAVEIVPKIADRDREEQLARAGINGAGPPFPSHDRVCSLLAPGGVPVPQGWQPCLVYELEIVRLLNSENKILVWPP
jgi:hypothetical protein